MKPLYLTTPVRQGLGKCLRPGGEKLTRRIIELLQPKASDTILDAGCGIGASIAMLQDAGCTDVFGLDQEYSLLAEQQRNRPAMVAQADIANLPLGEGCLHMALCECVWNLTQKEQVLSEFHRVLRPGGQLALTDIYLRGKGQDAWPGKSCFASATDIETVQKTVENSGFEILHLEDHSPLLKQTAAEFVFAHGSLQAFWQAVTGDSQMATDACKASATSRPGLFLLIARRNDL